MSIKSRASLVLAFIAAIMAATIATAFAEDGIIIREIKVTGNKRVEAETVKAHLTFTAKQPYDVRKADESVKALFATGLFRDVQIKLVGRTAIVTVVENQLINRVAFEGNKEIKSDVLSKEVQLKPHGTFVQGRVRADTQRVLDVYRRQGYYAAQVEAKTIELDNNRVDLIFEIREGPGDKGRWHQFYRKPFIFGYRTARRDLDD